MNADESFQPQTLHNETFSTGKIEKPLFESNFKTANIFFVSTCLEKNRTSFWKFKLNGENN